jgi:glycerophosphoryl diester phosphodiesterase
VSALLLGHRGAPSLHAENTLESFRAAIACGADGVELDVQVSADGVPVVLHDATVDRTTAGHGRAGAHSAEALGRLGVPRLDAVLQALRGHLVAVELKPSHDEHPDLAMKVCEISAAARAAERIWLLSFDHRHLAAARRHDRDVVTAALVVERPEDPVAVLRACGASLLACLWTGVDAPLCSAAHAAAAGVVAWTVDDPVDARRLVDGGVVAVISNRPCELVAALRR